MSMWKADIKSAYRLLPIKAQHREFAAVAFVWNKVKYVSGHRALPFGSVASMHAWDRIGMGLLCWLQRVRHASAWCRLAHQEDSEEGVEASRVQVLRRLLRG